MGIRHAKNCMRRSQSALLYAIPNDVKPVPFIHQGSNGTTDPRLQLGAAAVELDKRCTTLLIGNFGGDMANRFRQKVESQDPI